jgi:hypothetical protein
VRAAPRRIEARSGFAQPRRLRAVTAAPAQAQRGRDASARCGRDCAAGGRGAACGSACGGTAAPDSAAASSAAERVSCCCCNDCRCGGSGAAPGRGVIGDTRGVAGPPRGVTPI